MPPLELSQAVFTQMSTGPSRPVTASPSARPDAGSVTSTVSGTARAPGVRLPIRSAVSLALSATMSATATAAPASASRSDVAWPMPLPPPVTTATRPSRDHSRDRATSVKSGIMWVSLPGLAGPRPVGLDSEPLGIGREAATDVLGFEAELLGGVLVGAVLALRVLFLEVTHPAAGLVVDREAEVLVDPGYHGGRVGDQVVVLDVEEPLVPDPVPHLKAAVQPHLLKGGPFGAEPTRVEHRAVHGAQGTDEAHGGRYDLGRVTVRPDDARVGVHLEQRVQAEQVLGPLEHPLARVAGLQMLQEPPVVLVDDALVGVQVPLVIARDPVIGQVGLVGEAPVDEAEALLGAPGAVRVDRLQPGGARPRVDGPLDLGDARVGGGGRRLRGRRGQPHLPFGRRAGTGPGGEQRLQVGRAGAGQAGDDHRRLDFLGRDLWVALAVVHQPQPLDQGRQHEAGRDLRYPLGAVA